jgi:hypothetical protein
MQPRLPYARIEPQVTDQLLGRPKPRDLANRGDDAERHGHVHPGDRHQPPRLLLLEGDLRQGAIDPGQVLAREVQRTQQAVHRRPLVRRQWLLRQPCASLLAKQIRRRAVWYQIPVQDRMDLILQPCAVAHELRASGDLASQFLGPLVRHPHLGQEPRGVQLGQYPGIDLVCLDLRIGNGARPEWIRDDHPPRVAGQDPHDRVGVPRCLKDHIVRGAEAIGEDLQSLPRQINPPSGLHAPVLPDRDLCKRPMYIETEYAHPLPPLATRVSAGNHMGHTTPTDSRSQRIRASRRGGQILTRARSSSFDTGLPSLRATRCPGPGWSHHSSPRRRDDGRVGTDSFIPDTNVVESPFAAVRLRTAAAKRFKKVENATAVIWKTLLVAEQSFRRLDAPELLPEVAEGVMYVDGVRPKRGNKKVAA